MAESSRPSSKRKKTTIGLSAPSEPIVSAPPPPPTTATRRRRRTTTTDAPTQMEPPPQGETPAQATVQSPSFSSSRISSYFSNVAQQERYFESFQSREILDPKYLEEEFFESENFDCYQVFQNYNLMEFMTIKERHFSDLVRLFYCNLEIIDGCIRSEVKKVPIVIDQGLFYNLTNLSTEGEHFEGSVVNNWKLDYSYLDARKMICVEGADITGRLLAGSLNFDCRIMHYIISRILLPRLSNLAQLTEEDVILMWALLTDRRINWAHLVRHRMQKALKANAPLPYAHLITMLLEHFNVPLDDEQFVIVRRSYAIGAGAVASFGYLKNHLNQWVRKKDYQAEDQAERTPSPPRTSTSEPSSSTMSALVSELRGLRVFVGERFDSLDSRMTRIEDDIGSIRRHLGIHDDSVADDAP